MPFGIHVVPAIVSCHRLQLAACGTTSGAKTDLNNCLVDSRRWLNPGAKLFHSARQPTHQAVVATIPGRVSGADAEPKAAMCAGQ